MALAFCFYAGACQLLKGAQAASDRPLTGQTETELAWGSTNRKSGSIVNMFAAYVYFFLSQGRLPATAPGITASGSPGFGCQSFSRGSFGLRSFRFKVLLRISRFGRPNVQ
jgi:hypothetical protein